MTFYTLLTYPWIILQINSQPLWNHTIIVRIIPQELIQNSVFKEGVIPKGFIPERGIPEGLINNIEYLRDRINSKIVDEISSWSDCHLLQCFHVLFGALEYFPSIKILERACSIRGLKVSFYRYLVAYRTITIMNITIIQPVTNIPRSITSHSHDFAISIALCAIFINLKISQDFLF